MKCFLCKRPAEMSYDVDPEKPRPLCGACFGRWAPRELDQLLGVKQPEREYIEMGGVRYPAR